MVRQEGKSILRFCPVGRRKNVQKAQEMREQSKEQRRLLGAAGETSVAPAPAPFEQLPAAGDTEQCRVCPRHTGPVFTTLLCCPCRFLSVVFNKLRDFVVVYFVLRNSEVILELFRWLFKLLSSNCGGLD